MSDDRTSNAEGRRLEEDIGRGKNWKRWGPYLAERQWATVREDYSADAANWTSFPYEHSLGRAYRWGEDGLLGVCDRECRRCFALALWNGNDPHLKERLFGLTNPEGNHGEDVKEVYFYLDDVPTHFHRYVVEGDRSAVARDAGTKSAAVYILEVPAGAEAVVRLRLSAEGEATPNPFTDFDRVFADRRREADEFYASIIPAGVSDEERRVSRQAYAGLLWSEQFYHYVIPDWVDGDSKHPNPPEVRDRRINRDWPHLFSRDVLSVPDKWEYPAFFAWDLAFHMVPMARIDPEFAKKQLLLFLREWYLHPSGQIPAFEYDLSNVNPPVHAWACWQVYRRTGSETWPSWSGRSRSC